MPQKTRDQYFLKSALAKFEAKQTVFRQGDPGDYMYVILKGRIAVHVKMVGRDDITQLLVVPSDGEQFGELSLFDFNKYKTDLQQKADKSRDKLVSAGLIEAAPDLQRRGATCIAVEETICLRLDHATARNLLQPAKSDPIEYKIESPIRDKVNDEICRKLKFL